MRIALIAHDKKKSKMIKLACKYKDVLAKHEIYATGTTGRLIEEVTNLTISMPVLATSSSNSANESR